MSRKGKISSSEGPPTKRARRQPFNVIPGPKKVPLDFFTWGGNMMYDLGIDEDAMEVTRPRLNPNLKREDDTAVVDFCVGVAHMLAVDVKGRVWSWGSSGSAIGRDTSKFENSDEAEAKPGLVEGLPAGSIVQLVATRSLSAALLENGDVYAWGRFYGPQDPIGFSPTVMDQKTPAKVSGVKNIVQLASGENHLLALDAQGRVFSWGNNDSCQLGRKQRGLRSESTKSCLIPQDVGLRHVKHIGCGDNHSFAVTANDRVYSWGLNNYSQCGVVQEDQFVVPYQEIKPLAGKHIVSIKGGDRHSLALSSDGTVYSFGNNYEKQLGLGDKAPLDSFTKDDVGALVSLPVPTAITTLPPCKAIATRVAHSLAVTNDGLLFSWGMELSTALGLGPQVEDDVDVPKRVRGKTINPDSVTIIGCGSQSAAAAGVPLSDPEVAVRKATIEALEAKLAN